MISSDLSDGSFDLEKGGPRAGREAKAGARRAPRKARKVRSVEMEME
jgi:hypothetical protein